MMTAPGCAVKAGHKESNGPSRASPPVNLRLLSRTCSPQLNLTQLALLLTMSLVARSSALRQTLHSRALVPSRGVHGYKVCLFYSSYNEKLSHLRAHQHIPFNYEGSKAVFGTKVAVFLLSGFSIPFIASWYSLYVKVFGCRCHVGLTAVTFQEESCWRRIGMRRLSVPPRLGTSYCLENVCKSRFFPNVGCAMNNISSTCSNLRVSIVVCFHYRTIFITIHKSQSLLYCFLVVTLFL